MFGGKINGGGEDIKPDENIPNAGGKLKKLLPPKSKLVKPRPILKPRLNDGNPPKPNLLQCENKQNGAI